MTAAAGSRDEEGALSMKAKVIALLGGLMIALLLLSRYVALSRAGLPLGWMLYLGLPITAAGVVCAWRLINLGAGWGVQIEDAPRAAHPPSGPSLSERLKELDELHARGAISDTEYSARRLHIIAAM